MNSNFGLINQRQTPMLEIVRGHQFVDTSFGMSAAYPVADGVTIVSGQLITPVAGEWQLADNTSTTPIYYAVDDSTRPDVIEAGTLNGLSSTGQFELEIPFYDDVTYAVGDQLSASDTAGNAKPAAGGEAVVGTVLAIDVPIAGKNSNVVDQSLLVLRVRTQPIVTA